MGFASGGAAGGAELTDSAAGAMTAGASTAVGNANTAARDDHVHSREAFATPSGSHSHGGSAGAGSANTVTRADHSHALPAAGGVPADLIGFFENACPDGWSEFTAARGRYVVGTPSGGVAEATVGTALSNSEDRAVGQHLHTSGASRSNSNGNSLWCWNRNADASKYTANSGTVASTNAPYVQLMCCMKD